jgi:tetratricopeptide (TPR) repeat protein
MKNIGNLGVCAWLFLAAVPVFAETPAEKPKETAAAEPRETAVTLAKGVAGSYLSGQYAKTSGDIGQAIRYLKRAHREDTTNYHITVQLQNLLLVNGEIEEALKLAKETNAAGHKDSLGGLLLSLQLIKSGNEKKAAELLAESFDEENGQLWLPLVMSWLDVGTRTLDKPVKVEDLKVNVGRALPIVSYHLALINSRAGFKEQAAVDFKGAITDPANPPVRMMEMLLRFHEQNGKPEILKPVVESFLGAFPGHVQNPDEKIVYTTPEGVAEVLFTMGSIMQGAGVEQDAIIYLQLARYLKPDFHLATLVLADTYSDARQYGAANALYNAIPAGSRYYGKAQLGTAINEDRAGKTGSAIAILDKLSKRGADGYSALVAKGDLLRLRMRFAEAVEAYTVALKKIPQLQSQHWPIFFARGSCLERLGKWPQAEKDLQKALELKPDQPDVLNYLGYSWLTRHENIPLARDMLEKAIKARPNDPQIVDSMGWALYLLKEYDEAAVHLEKALELLPGDPTINDHLGDAYWRLGRNTEARYQWERSLSFSPEDAKEAESIRRKLKEGLPQEADANPFVPPMVTSGQSSSDTAVP